jgi:hypothetical protein
LKKSADEISYADLFGKFSASELQTIKKSAEQLTQTRVNREDPQSEVFLESLEVLATAIKSVLNEDDKDLKGNFSSSSVARNLNHLYNQDFLDNLMALRANKMENLELRDSASNLLAYLNRAANTEPEKTEKPPF